jgi:two-component system response regulator YesN
MLKVVLADDEPLLREGLAADVPWGELGMELVGVAEDGEQALEMIERLLPELVITDVRMPFVDGLQLIERTKEAVPEADFVVISGYDEFQYAQRAIGLGVKEYVLKPIDLGRLCALLERIRGEHERRLRERQAVRQGRASQREEFFKGLIRGTVDPGSVRVLLGEFGFGDRCRCWAAAVLILDGPTAAGMRESGLGDGEPDRNLPRLLQALAAQNEGVSVFNSAIDEYVLCLASTGETRLRQTASGIFRRIHEAAAAEMGCTVTIAVGPVVESADRLGDSCEAARQALRWRYLLGAGRDIFYDQMLVSDQAHQLSVDPPGGELFTDITLGNRGAVEAAIDALFRDARDRGEDAHSCLQLAIAVIFSQTGRILNDLGIAPGSLSGPPLRDYRTILELPTIEETQRELMAHLTEVMLVIARQRTGRLKRVTEAAKEYIQAHFTESDLTLEQVARAVALSPCYLSALFKPETGLTLKEYVTSLRLHKARELICSSSYRVAEIGYQVGFSNPNYFSTLFKRRFGRSPKEYRDAKTKESEAFFKKP